MKGITELKFEDKAIFALNDIATIVLDWNLGKLSEVQAMKKINQVFVNRK